ncbi:MAG: Peptidil-prolyl cis-trans isomerase [Candidatus Moranbacteria bacterium GW2011_GWE1_49_15]|nr:MAG: Peptidil-prolyl cis-trans isomerase [Candidatus Moranbacteria bacterium GW2011_GWE2_47_10]KKW06582.1 MAG: Peptidil-prolyl cis-trans isomerase [Candidatus Moranbacteria bacterium GW2011_GWE1_49_15]HBP01535.1 hypothetical protein [Candidatus Moranbacteria bacterium]
MEKEAEKTENGSDIQGGKAKKVSFRTLAISSGLILSVLFAAGVGIIYFVSPDENTPLGRFVGRFSYPAAVIDGKSVVYTSQVDENLEAVKNFYEREDVSKTGMRADFSTEEGRKRLKIKEKEILNKIIEDKAIEILAKKEKIVVTKEDVDKAVDGELEKYGNKKEVSENMQNLYGWNIEQFKTKIVAPGIYSQELRRIISAELESDEGAREIIGKAKRELDNGTDFSEVARMYSQGSSAQDGGEFGWIAKEQLVAEVAEKIFGGDFPVNPDKKKTEIIESPLGFHIIKVEEMKKENGTDLARIKQIFARKKTFGDWLEERMKEMNINVLDKEYQWDKENGIVIFKDEGMRNFEKETYEKWEGDISVMF